MSYQIRSRAPGLRHVHRHPRMPVRVSATTLIALLALSLFSFIGQAQAATQDVVELAAEAPAEGEPLPGPEPTLDPEANEFAPEPYEPPWTFALGIILSVVAVLAIVATGLGWMRLRRAEEHEGSGGTAGR